MNKSQPTPSPLTREQVEEAIKRAALCASVEWPGEFARHLLSAARERFDLQDELVETESAAKLVTQQAQEMDKEAASYKKVIAANQQEFAKMEELLATVTRERVALLADELRTCHPDVYQMKRDGLTGYLTQQAQEIERLERQLELDAQQIQAVRDQCKPYTDMRDHVVEMVVEVVNKLAAMTTERDELKKERDLFWQQVSNRDRQLATAQALVKVLERENKSLKECQCDRCNEVLEDSDAFCLKCFNALKQQIATEQAESKLKELNS